MNRTNIEMVVLLAAFSAALWFAGAAEASQNAAERDESKVEPPVMVVHGQAEIEVPADQFSLALSVVTEADESDKAVSENSDKARKVAKALRRAGLSDDEVQTRRFTIRPVYANRSRSHSEAPKIVGYRVENEVLVETTQLKLAGELIQEAVEAGANQVSSLTFDLKDPQSHRAEAIREATANARSDAEALAEAAGVNLGRVHRLELDPRNIVVPMRYGRTMALEGADAGGPPPIDPGEVQVSARVTIEYRIGK